LCEVGHSLRLKVDSIILYIINFMKRVIYLSYSSIVWCDVTKRNGDYSNNFMEWASCNWYDNYVLRLCMHVLYNTK